MNFRNLLLCAVAAFAGSSPAQETSPAPKKEKIRLITLDPGHFHAALVQKRMYDQVDPVVHIYAPAGDDLDQHIARIEGFNTRPESPTSWTMKVHTSPNFFEQMIKERPGNVVVTSGNNARKTEYIAGAIEAGLNVLSDKPMCIDPPNFELLKKAFKTAREKGVLLYDTMPERYETTNELQRELAQMPELFGTLTKGTPTEPAISKESVHHFSKTVAGKPLKRPPWFFDVTQEGEGIVDVTTHLVDLVQWGGFPGQILNPEEDIKMLDARRSATTLTLEQFSKMTGFAEFPGYLQKDVKDGVLHVMSNGEMTYRVKGVHAKVSVAWHYEAPPGSGDMHYSIMRGSKANLVIRQGVAEHFKPTLYVENVAHASEGDFEKAVRAAIEKIVQTYPGVDVKKSGNGWSVEIPEKYKVGHEAHFAQVTDKYLGFLAAGKIPDWEEQNMIAKYHTIMEAYKKSR